MEYRFEFEFKIDEGGDLLNALQEYYDFLESQRQFLELKNSLKSFYSVRSDLLKRKNDEKNGLN